MNQVLLSGVLTGMVSTLVLVPFLLVLDSCRPHPNSTSKRGRKKPVSRLHRRRQRCPQETRQKRPLPRLLPHLHPISDCERSLLLFLLIRDETIRRGWKFSPRPHLSRLSSRRDCRLQQLALDLPHWLCENSDAVPGAQELEIQKYVVMCSTPIPARGLQGLLQGIGDHHAEIVPRQCCCLLLLWVSDERDGLEERMILWFIGVTLSLLKQNYWY